jgi:hypothetical protein
LESKLQRVSERDSRGYAKRKLNQVQNVLTSKIATIGGFDPDDIAQSSTSLQCSNCLDYDHLLEELKKKLCVSSRLEFKLPILTLPPASWSIKKASVEFGVSERMIKKARKLKMEEGILAIAGKKRGKKLSNEVKQKVLQFFEDDEFSRMCPGKMIVYLLEWMGKRCRYRNDCCSAI